MRIFPLFLGLLLMASCTSPTPSPEPPAAPTPTPTENTLLQTAIAKATELAAATPDPRLQRTPTTAVTTTPSADWKLVWSDEFDGPDGSRVNNDFWTPEQGGSGWGNNELEYYTSHVENAYLENGSLVIEARKEQFGGNAYTSARLVTRGKAAWTYGRFEIRAKLPKGQGIWPAIWLMPDTNTYGNWPAGGEVDIMELLGHAPATVYGTLHWGNPHASSGKSFTLVGVPDFSEEYHVFTLEWEPGEFRWYVDGVQYHTVNKWMTSSPGAVFPAPFDKPFYVILNVAVGGSWPGSPDSTTIFPQKMYVDYVRVYQEQ
jgi:beta-glucanase (GH16 family)